MMKFKQTLELKPLDRAFLKRMLEDYLRLKNPEFKKSRITTDQELLLFAEGLLNIVE